VYCGGHFFLRPTQDDIKTVQKEVEHSELQQEVKQLTKLLRRVRVYVKDLEEQNRTLQSKLSERTRDPEEVVRVILFGAASTMTGLVTCYFRRSPQ